MAPGCPTVRLKARDSVSAEYKRVRRQAGPHGCTVAKAGVPVALILSFGRDDPARGRVGAFAVVGDDGGAAGAARTATARLPPALAGHGAARAGPPRAVAAADPVPA